MALFVFVYFFGGGSHLSIPSSPATGSQLLMKSQGVPRTAALLCFKVHFTGFGGGSGWMGVGGVSLFCCLFFHLKSPFDAKHLCLCSVGHECFITIVRNHSSKAEA